MDVNEYSCAHFGIMLKDLIRTSEMSNTKFYTKLGITKPYFYDIVSGKVKPLPAEIQFKMVKVLNLDITSQQLFFEMAGRERNEIPADVSNYIKNNQKL